MNTTRHLDRRGQVNLQDLLLLVLMLLGALAGFSVGIRFGSNYGILGTVLGGLLGPVAGIAAVVLGVLLFAVLVCEPLDRFGQWWRPYPPPCENGTCAGWDHYRPHKIPDEVCGKVKGLSSSGHRCACGNVYGGGFDYGMRNRWVRVLPSGEIRPYLKHRLFGRWRPDDGTDMPGPDVGDEKDWTQLQVPGWVLPPCWALLCGGIALAAVLKEARTVDSVGAWLIALVTAMGAAGGCIAWWWDWRKQD